MRGLSLSADMEATLRAVRGLGVSVRLEGDAACFTAVPLPPSAAPLPVDCGESGSTLRFLIPLYAARGIPAVFTGHGRLPERPLGVYADCLPAHGVALSAVSGLPLTVSGRLTGGDFALPGDVSSQFITGLLFALPLCREDSRIRLTTPLESAGYVDMTLQVLRQAGIRVEPLEDGWFIPGNQTYQPLDAAVESDWSQAAFLLAAGALGGSITLTGLNTASAQGDREALALFRRFGAAIEEAPGRITCRKAPLHGIDIDAAQIPDLVPSWPSPPPWPTGSPISPAQPAAPEGKRPPGRRGRRHPPSGRPGGGRARFPDHYRRSPPDRRPGGRGQRSPHRHGPGRGGPGL